MGRMKKRRLQKSSSDILSLPWWEVKYATVGNPGAPSNDPQASTMPAPQVPEQPPPEPSPSDVFSHQAKMQEMGAQKSLVEAKANAETTKARASAMASTPVQAAQLGQAQPPPGQPQPQQPQQPQQQQQQQATQMPQAQW